MTAEPASNESAAQARDSLLMALGIAVSIAVAMIVFNSWLDSRKPATIVFLSTPDTSIAAEVRGAISTPGVVYLDPGSRLIDAINAAGGLAPDADQSLINLSTRVGDGQVIVIPTQVSVNQASANRRININTASANELKELPGIGDVLAQRIIEHRELNGPFLTPEDLLDVDGISPSLVESLLPLVTVSGND